MTVSRFISERNQVDFKKSSFKSSFLTQYNQVSNTERLWWQIFWPSFMKIGYFMHITAGDYGFETTWPCFKIVLSITKNKHYDLVSWNVVKKCLQTSQLQTHLRNNHYNAVYKIYLWSELEASVLITNFPVVQENI